MEELGAIKAAVEPQNVLLVVDAMIGQDAVKTSKAFHERLGLTGVVLTKLDGDARGGAALSVKDVTGAPVRFVGVGETLDKFEEFRADGMASRVLGMGDVVGLMKDFEEVVDEKDAAEKAMQMLEGQFTLDDFLEQIRMIQKMGSLKDLIAKMPGMGDMIPPGANLDDKELGRVEAIIQSLTKFERRDPYALIREPTRVQRVSKGSGQPETAGAGARAEVPLHEADDGRPRPEHGDDGEDPGAEERRDGQADAQADGPGRHAGDGVPGDARHGLAGDARHGLSRDAGMGFPGMGMPGGRRRRREHDEDAAAVDRREERAEGGAQAREGRPEEEPAVTGLH